MSDPVQRLYSDYYFLEDDRSVVKQNRGNFQGRISTKSAKAFHDRSVEQINLMRSCIQDVMTQLLRSNGVKSEGNKEIDTADAMKTGSPYWFRASQM